MAVTIYSLTGTRCELLLQVSDVAEVLYFGRRLEHNDSLSEMAPACERAIPYGRLDDDVPVSLSPQLARGSFASPGLEGHVNGLNWAPQFTVSGVEAQEHALVITSEDSRAGLELTVTLTLDASDVLTMSQQLSNSGSKGYSITRFANTLPLPQQVNEVMSFYGRWVKEFQPARTQLTAGGYISENRRGRTSHEHYPALIAGEAGFTDNQGAVWGAHLGWSGNHRMRLDIKADGRRVLQAEALYLPGEIYLKPQQSICTPTLYMSYSPCGLNRMSQQFHRYVRHTILGGRLGKPRPVHLNTWEGIYFQHDPDYIAQMAREAATIGVERFIVDDGWFGARNDDTSSLGDWFIDEHKYPQGIGALIATVHELGMEFGLWFEPEMVNKDSDLYRRHPDWLLAVNDYDTPTGRHQHVLDLQNPAVFDYLYQRLDHFLSSYAIDYIKWDMNREVVQPGHNGMAAGYGQVERYYALIDKLIARHPQVEIESCAAGGGRIDYEVLKRTHRFWASDNNDALERITIQQNMRYFFPPEVMGSHIGAMQSHTTRRTHSLAFRALTALWGHMGLELDPVTISETDKQAYRHYVALHKQWRTLLHSGDNYQLAVEDNAAQRAHMVLATDKSRALVGITQLAMGTYSLSGVLRIPALLPGVMYRISVLEQPQGFNDIVNRQPPWTRQGICLSGEWLANVGLAMPLLDPESALLLAVEQVSQ